MGSLPLLNLEMQLTRCKQIEDLNLVSNLLLTPNTSPAAQNRFIYYPDSLVRLPGPGRFFDNLRTIWSEPALDGLMAALWHELITPQRDSLIVDESVGDFVSRRLDKQLANNTVSAILHGIYAGDLWQLSARSLLPLQWEQEMRQRSLVVAGAEAAFNKHGWAFADDLECQVASQQDRPISEALKEKIISTSVLTFDKGLESLANGLRKRLKEHGMVNIRLRESVQNIKADRNGVQVSRRLEGLPSISRKWLMIKDQNLFGII